MAAKSIITIDVDSSQFSEFYELFQKYEERLKEAPEDWKKVANSIDDALYDMGEFEDVSQSTKEAITIAAIQADLISKAIQKSTGAQDKLNVKTKDGAIQMGRMAKFSKEMHKDISKMSGIFLKLGALGGAALAIPTAVFAATNKLAGQNLQARGLGLRIGQTQAFEANFEKFGLGSSDLGNMANVQGDPTKWRALIAAGMTPEQIQNEDAEQLTYDFARAASGKYREWQKSGMPAGSMAQAYGFTDFLSLQQLRTGASYSDADWMKAQQKEIDAAKKAAVDQGTADQASDVKAALKSDLAEVINAFDNQLAQASEPLKKLADAAAAAAINLLNVAGPQAKSVLDALAGGPVSKSDAQKSETLAGALARLGYNIRDLSTVGSIESGHNAPVFKWDWKHPFGTITHQSVPASRGGAPSPALMGILDAQYQVESSRGKKLLSPAGAKGPFGFMEDTWKEWGHGDVNNLRDSADAAARYDTYLMSRYGGDVRKALAAYNWGMGSKSNPRLDADIAAHGSDWEKYAPRETQNYIKKILAISARQGQTLNVNITNSTTANVATSMNAAPH